MVQSFTTDVTERNGMLIIIKNVPCYKCTECNDVFYTGDVLAQLERLRKKAEEVLTELTVIDFDKVA
jgi:YgiT-type zinc finger domain-containing protein